MIQDHYDIVVKYSKPCLNSSSQNYFWFMQYMNYDNDDLGESTLSPPKIVIINIIFLQLKFLVTYGHHILDYFYLF